MLRCAIVGLGWWGQILARAIHGKSERLRIIRAVTARPEAATSFAREMGLVISGDYHAVLRDPEVEAIIIATPHSCHVDQVVRAAKAGKHVFCEKPLALRVEDARLAFEACRAAGVVLAVGHNMRYLPAAMRLAEIVAEGALGVLMHVEGQYSGPSAYRRAPGSWRLDPAESPLGGMTGMGVHLSDLMIAMLGPVETVFAISSRRVVQSEVDDTTCMLLRFRSGPTGSLATLTATADVWRLQVLGSKGWAEMRGLHRLVTAPVNGPESVVQFPSTDVEKRALEAFADAVAGRSSYPISEDQVMSNVGLLQAASNSANQGLASGVEPSTDCHF